MRYRFFGAKIQILLKTANSSPKFLQIWLKST